MGQQGYDDEQLSLPFPDHSDVYPFYQRSVWVAIFIITYISAAAILAGCSSGRNLDVDLGLRTKVTTEGVTLSTTGPTASSGKPVELPPEGG